MIYFIKMILTGFFSLLFVFPVFSQEKFFICLSDKGPKTTQNISLQQQWLNRHFTKKALERRQLRGSTKGFTPRDYPLYKPYTDELERKGVRIIHRLRWLNAVSAVLSEQDKQNLKRFPFIQDILPVKSFIRRNSDVQRSNSFFEIPERENALEQVIEFVNAAPLKLSGGTGDGVLVGVFDTGFEINIPAMEHVRLNTIDAYDFVHNDTVVYNQEGESAFTSSHGTSVSSLIGGYYNNADYTFEGLAPDVSFLLYKTEDIRTETHVEEDNWVAAAERAEMLGVDIVNTSVGYSTFDSGEENYTYEDMDGETTIITRAANNLTENGVVVVTSAGNEGNDPWYYISAPADGYEVIAVGAVYLSGSMAYFSSNGPTADGRIKPEVVAPGVSVPCINNSGTISYSSGTSFASPIVAGGIALLLERMPALSISDLRLALTVTSSLSLLINELDNPDNRHGYGVPQFWELYKYFNPDSFPAIRKAFTVYPNPVVHRGNFFVSFSSPLEAASLFEIYNILGQKVYANTIRRGISLKEISDDRFFRMPTGIYFATIRVNGERYFHKIIRIK